MHINSAVVVFHPSLVPFALGQDFVFPLETIRCVPKSLLVQQFTVPLLVSQRQEPIPGKIIRACKTFLYSAYPVVLAAKVYGTLLNKADGSLVYVNFTAKNRVLRPCPRPFNMCYSV